MSTTTQICLTVPTLLGVERLFRDAYQYTIVAHPNISAAILLALSIWPAFPFKAVYLSCYAIPRAIILWPLRLLGFRKEGVAPDSFASNYQSRVYGGYVPSDSRFATYQRYGTIDSDILVYERPAPLTPWRLFLVGFRWSCLIASCVVFFGQKRN